MCNLQKMLDAIQVFSARFCLDTGTDVHGMGAGRGNGFGHIFRTQTAGKNQRIPFGHFNGCTPLPDNSIAARQRAAGAFDQESRWRRCAPA